MTTVKEPPTGPKPASFLKSVISQLKPQRHPEAPANKPSHKLADPTRIGVLSDEPERKTSLNASASRCQFTFADGRQCKTPPVQLCAHHAPKQKLGAKRVSDASALEALCSDLTTATSINRALTQTFLLMAQGRISRKDAVAFGYLSQLLLQSVSGVRAEYVAANGYRQWENKLKSSLASNQNDADDPPPSPQNPGNEPNGVILSESASADERRISPNPTQERPLAERIMGKPDYQSLLTRSLDMLDRKYDFTPEGRSESQKLVLELELMNPAPAKPAKGFFGQTVDLMRRFRDGEKQNSGAASIPPALDYYARPTPPPWADERNEQSVSPPPSRGTSSPTVPNQQACSSEPVAAAVPEAQRSPSASDAADFVAPPSRRPRKPRSHSRAPSSAPHSELPSPLPISSTTAKHDSLGGPDADHHEGHCTDWYAPPSWSKTRPPDPCPSRKEKLQRKLRSVSNSAFRRLQHRNSRGF